MSKPIASLTPVTANATLLVSSLAANALLIFVPILVGRGLEPDEHGACAALSSFFMIAAVESSTLPFMASQIAIFLTMLRLNLLKNDASIPLVGATVIL